MNLKRYTNLPILRFLLFEQLLKMLVVIVSKVFDLAARGIKALLECKINTFVTLACKNK